MRFAGFFLVVAPFVMASALAHAEAPAAKAGAAKASAAKAAAAKSGAPNAIPKDEKGVRGISSYQEAVAKGDAAVMAHDLDAALQAYRDAIGKNAQLPLAHYRVGQVQAAKGDLKSAEQSYTTALGFANDDAALKAKLLFCLADIKERQRADDAAHDAWAAYEAQLTAEPKVKGHPATAAERKKRIEEWKKVSADAAAVKARIEKRLKEADDSTRKSSR